MPGFDRTGPLGKGQGTGRGFGRCRPENQVGNVPGELHDIPVGNTGKFGRMSGSGRRCRTGRRKFNRGENN
jgi:hypothetical protein